MPNIAEGFGVFVWEYAENGRRANIRVEKILPSGRNCVIIDTYTVVLTLRSLIRCTKLNICLGDS